MDGKTDSKTKTIKNSHYLKDKNVINIQKNIILHFSILRNKNKNLINLYRHIKKNV